MALKSRAVHFIDQKDLADVYLTSNYSEPSSFETRAMAKKLSDSTPTSDIRKEFSQIRSDCEQAQEYVIKTAEHHIRAAEEIINFEWPQIHTDKVESSISKPMLLLFSTSISISVATMKGLQGDALSLSLDAMCESLLDVFGSAVLDQARRFVL